MEGSRLPLNIPEAECPLEFKTANVVQKSDGTTNLYKTPQESCSRKRSNGCFGFLFAKMASMKPALFLVSFPGILVLEFFHPG